MKIKDKRSVAVVIVVGLVSLILISKITGQTGSLVPLNVNSNNIVPRPTLTPTPIIFNFESNLEEEIDKITPEDFSQDFKALKEEISGF